MQTFRIFVLHVRNGYEARAIHVEHMMNRLGLKFEYITQGDVSDLTDVVMGRWFAPTGELGHRSGATSCAYKHLLACKKILDENLPGAVVLEDDILLRPNFTKIVERSIRELPPDAPAIINYEDSRLRFVPRSRRRPNHVIYIGDRDRYTGALYINAAGAKAVLDAAESRRMSVPIDIFHRRLLEAGKITYWWSHPCPATQGSFDGTFSSSLTDSHSKALVWRIKKAYRKLLYWFR